jgi:hypothetical protein
VYKNLQAGAVGKFTGRIKLQDKIELYWKQKGLNRKSLYESRCPNGKNGKWTKHQDG